VEDLGRDQSAVLRCFAMQESVWLIHRASMGPLGLEAVRSQAQVSPAGFGCCPISAFVGMLRRHRPHRRPGNCHGVRA